MNAQTTSPLLLELCCALELQAFLFESMWFRMLGQGAAIAVPGFHLHFLSADRKRGGHVLDCALSTGAALMHPLYRTEADMPHSADFLHADLNRDPLQDIREAETGTVGD